MELNDSRIWRHSGEAGAGRGRVESSDSSDVDGHDIDSDRDCVARSDNRYDGDVNMTLMSRVGVMVEEKTKSSGPSTNDIFTSVIGIEPGLA